jgi:hypothetical protein
MRLVHPQDSLLHPLTKCIISLIEIADIVSVNPLIPQSWGAFLKLGDTPRPPAGGILHLFVSSLDIKKGEALPPLLVTYC